MIPAARKVLPPLLLVLSGCVSLPDKIALAPAPPEPRRLAIADNRPPESKASRVKVDALGKWIYLGDDYFTPPPARLLASFLDERLPQSIGSGRVTITQLDTFVTVFGMLGPSAGMPLPTPAHLAGAAIGQALADAMHRRHTFVTIITVSVDGKEYTAGHNTRLVASEVPSQIRGVVYAAFCKLLDKISPPASSGGTCP